MTTLSLRAAGYDARDEDSTARLQRLLRATTDVATVLAREPRVEDALALALPLLGEATGVDRVNAIRYDHGANAGMLLADWARPGTPSLRGVHDGPFGFDDYAEVWRPVMAGRVYHAPTREKSGANRALNERVRTRTDLHVPVLVDGVFWGVLNFDDCTAERRWSDGEVEVLRSAAAALAAAIAREAMEAAHRDAVRRRDQLLDAIVSASRELLDAPDLRSGLDRWLPHLARAAGADRAGIGTFAPDHDGAARPVNIVDWSRAGLGSLSGVAVPRSRDFDEWSARLAAGETIWATYDDLVDPASRGYWDATACDCNLIVPVQLDGRSWGWLYFDFSERRPFRAADAAVLRTAAEGVAAAVRRDLVTERARREREQAAEERAGVLRAHNELLAHRAALLQTITEVSQDLIRLPDPTLAFDEVVARLGVASGTDRVCLMSFLKPDAGSRRGYVRMEAEWDAPGVIRQMDTNERVIALDALGPLHDEWMRGRLVFPTRELPEPFRSGQAALGVHTQVAVIIRGATGEPWGFIGFDDCTRDREWDVALVAVLQVAGALLGTALERWQAERQRARAEAERQRAELAAAAAHASAADARAHAAEARTRLAQELHDTIAQDFAAVQLHLGIARDAAEPSRVRQAIDAADATARHGLAESRRTLAILRAPSVRDAEPRERLTLDRRWVARQLRVAVRERCRRAAASPRPAVAVRVGDEVPPLHTHVLSALLRIADAAVTNALQHAGARRLHVRLAGGPRGVRLVVRDDGRGFDTAAVPADRYGLLGMRERAEAVGARCEVVSAPGAGTRVTVRWPLARPAGAR